MIGKITLNRTSYIKWIIAPALAAKLSLSVKRNSLNTLPEDLSLDLPFLEALADDKIITWWDLPCDRARKTVGKVEICGYSNTFSRPPPPTMFSSVHLFFKKNALVFNVIKTMA